MASMWIWIGLLLTLALHSIHANHVPDEEEGEEHIRQRRDAGLHFSFKSTKDRWTRALADAQTQVQQGINTAAQTVDNNVANGVRSVEGFTNNIKRTVQNQLGQVRDAVQDLKKAYDNRVAEAKQQVSQAYRSWKSSYDNNVKKVESAVQGLQRNADLQVAKAEKEVQQTRSLFRQKMAEYKSKHSTSTTGTRSASQPNLFRKAEDTFYGAAYAIDNMPNSQTFLAKLASQSLSNIGRAFGVFKAAADYLSETQAPKTATRKSQ